jgi:hypothetical protein
MSTSPFDVKAILASAKPLTPEEQREFDVMDAQMTRVMTGDIGGKVFHALVYLHDATDDARRLSKRELRGMDEDQRWADNSAEFVTIVNQLEALYHKIFPPSELEELP